MPFVAPFPQKFTPPTQAYLAKTDGILTVFATAGHISNAHGTIWGKYGTLSKPGDLSSVKWGPVMGAAGVDYSSNFSYGTFSIHVARGDAVLLEQHNKDTLNTNYVVSWQPTGPLPPAKSNTIEVFPNAYEDQVTDDSPMISDKVEDSGRS